MKPIKDLIINLKGALGFCQCHKCWSRSEYTLNINGSSISKDICESHKESIIRDLIIEKAIGELKY